MWIDHTDASRFIAVDREDMLQIAGAGLLVLAAELYLARRRWPYGSAEVKLLNYTPVAVND